MTAFFTWLGNYLIGWIVLAYLCAAFLSALMWGRILRLNERPREPEAEPVNLVADVKCSHGIFTTNQGGAFCLKCGERVA